MMRAIATNNLIALTSPDCPGIFRIMFTEDAPDVTLEKVSAESPVPIIIHLTKEIEVNPRLLAGWPRLLGKFKQVRPNSKWLLMEPDDVQAIFDVSHHVVEPPPFLEHMPTDEGRSRSMEPESKELCNTESEYNGDTAPAGIKIPIGAKWNKPTCRGYSRNLWECFKDGTQIWHARTTFKCDLHDSPIPHPNGWYGQYNAKNNVIIGDADGKKYATMGAFVNAHYDLHGCEKQNGWDTCKYLINGDWKDVGTIKLNA